MCQWPEVEKARCGGRTEKTLTGQLKVVGGQRGVCGSGEAVWSTQIGAVRDIVIQVEEFRFFLRNEPFKQAGEVGVFRHRDPPSVNVSGVLVPPSPGEEGRARCHAEFSVLNMQVMCGYWLWSGGDTDVPVSAGCGLRR